MLPENEVLQFPSVEAKELPMATSPHWYPGTELQFLCCFQFLSVLAEIFKWQDLLFCPWLKYLKPNSYEALWRIEGWLLFFPEEQVLLKQSVNMDGYCCDESIIKVPVTQWRATPAGKTGICCLKPGKKEGVQLLITGFFFLKVSIKLRGRLF